jgi:hypothetical protein
VPLLRWSVIETGSASFWARRQAFSISGSLVPTVYSLMPSTLTSTASVV